MRTTRFTNPIVSLSLVLASFALLELSPSRAAACGGLFCDGGTPTPMPVDQTGEDILFIHDGEEMEVHVRIQYTGEAERFAWMVPLPAVPEVSVGSEPLFAELGRATIPVWLTTRSFQNGGDAPSPSVFAPDDPGADTDPVVVYQDTVGIYEVVVLEATSATEVLGFFEANDYSFEAKAEPIIQQYIDEGFLITGVKLSAGAAVDTVHPLVFRFVGDEPCVPIRLTAVGASQDMGIRAYFLGQERWAPSNYRHVQLNPMAYDWTNPGILSYVELLSLAVDEAGGRAFATEYAGPSNKVATPTIWNLGWSEISWSGLSAWAAINALNNAGLLPWGEAPAPQILRLLRKYIPVSPDWRGEEIDYWLGYWQHPHLFEPATWDPDAFAAEFEQFVVTPGHHAVDMLAAWPYLTRLHTTISPEEMIVDPIFHPTPDLPQVGEDRVTSAYVFTDFEWTRYRLELELELELNPVGIERFDACVEDDGDWPVFADMPRALRIEQVPMTGPIQVVTNNRAAILALVEAHNAGSPCEEAEPSDTGHDDDAGDTGSDDAGSTALAAGDSACACTLESTPGSTPLGFGLAVLTLVGVRRRQGQGIRSGLTNP